MKKLFLLRIIALALTAWVTTCAYAAPVYQPSPIQHAAGGGQSFDSRFNITGSIGQPMAAMSTGAVFRVASGFWAVTSAPLLPPPCLVVRGPTNLLTTCQSTNGAFVVFAVSATNMCEPLPVQVMCTPSSGSLFPVGSTWVHCTASSGGNASDHSFIVTVSCPARPILIDGVVLDREGQPTPGIQITLTGAVTRATLTDAAGRFEFSGLPAQGSYAVIPSEANYQFTPSRHDFPQAGQDATADFVVVTPFEQWQQTQWPSNTPPAVTLPEADADGDRMPNLLEYAFGHNPLVQDNQGQLRIEFEQSPAGPRPAICFRLAPYATDIDFHLEYTDRLDDSVWQILPESIVPTAGPPPPGWPEIRIPIPARLLPAEATFWRLDVCRRARICPHPALLANNGDSLRIGFMNVQFMDSAAMFAGSVFGEFQECCGGADRGGEIAGRIIAGDYDVVALAEAWVDGGGLLPKALLTFGPTVELAAREWARRHLPASTTEEEIVRLIETWERIFGPTSGNSKARLTEILARAGYVHRVEKLDDSGNLQDSGLMLFSRWPFERLPAETRAASARYIRYLETPLGTVDFGVQAFSGTMDWGSDVGFIEFPSDHCSGNDCLSAKGAGFVRVRNPRTGIVYNVAFTHLQASDNEDATTARAGQLRDIKEMIETILGGRVLNEPVLVLGDFNIKGSLSPREEWVKYFHPGGEGAWDGFFINTLADAWERQVATVGDARSPAPPGIAPVPAGYRDPGLSGNADVGGNARYDYLLINDPSLINNQSLSVQHLALAYNLMGEPTANRAAFGFEGSRILSDHFGLVADINLRRDYSSPATALVEPNLLHDDEEGKSYPTSIQVSGGMKWWRFDARGTYSFGATPSNNFEYLVFSSRNLSRPLKPVRPDPRILNYRDPSGTSNQVAAYSFHADDAPLYVRVTARSRSSTGDFGLVARRHQCTSQEDSCELLPNTGEFEVRPVSVTVSDRERWFRLQTECPTSRRRQSIGFAKRPADPALEQHHAVSLESFAGVTPVSVADPVESTALIQLGNTSFNDGGEVVYARVTPFADTLRTTYYVRWTNNLTVFDPYFIRNDEPLDNDVIWDNQDDEFDRITVTLRDTSMPDTTFWSHTTALGGAFLDFNDNHRRDISLTMFPTVRFLPDEVFHIKFEEDDVTTHDEMSATVAALAENETGSDVIVVIQSVSGAGGRYQIHGHKRHFGRREPPSCPDP